MSKIKLLNIFFKKLGVRIEKIGLLKDVYLINVFKNPSASKRALVSYTTGPFRSGFDLKHTQFVECYTACKIFDELGYSVDVVNYSDNAIVIDYSQYDLIYGFGHPLEKSFYSYAAEKVKKIYYGTGTSLFSFYKRNGRLVYEFYKNNSSFIPESARLHFGFWPVQLTCSDAIIALGNDVCRQSYEIETPYLNIYKLSAFFHDVLPKNKIITKNFEKAKNNFIWFGSGGLLYKGLGLLIEVFSRREDVNLYICGAPEGESKFWNFYLPIISQCNNIINCGFVELGSEKFYSLTQNIAFAIFPSTSEGGAPATLNLLANDYIIPVISRESTLSVDTFGIYIEHLDYEYLNKLIDELLSFNHTELEIMSKKAFEVVRKDYTLDNYKANLKSILKKVVEAN